MTVDTQPRDVRDDLTDISCCNERILSAIGVVEQILHEAFEMEPGPTMRDEAYRAWMLLVMVRETFTANDKRFDEAHTAVLQFAPIHIRKGAAS